MVAVRRLDYSGLSLQVDQLDGNSLPLRSQRLNVRALHLHACTGKAIHTWTSPAILIKITV